MQKVSLFAAAFALSILSIFQASATPVLSSEVNWGTLGTPDVQFFGNSFATAGSYNDGYRFTLTSPANTFGGAIEVNTVFNKLDINVATISLYKGGFLIGSDTSPISFSFSNLVTGSDYLLVVSLIVTSEPGFWKIPVAYAGLIASVLDVDGSPAEAPLGTPVPAALPLFATVLVGGGFAAWRRKRKQKAEAIEA